MRKCPACGSIENDDSVSFCVVCGANFPSGNDATKSQVPYTPSPYMPGAKKVSGAKVAALLAGMILVATWFIFITMTPSEDPTVEDEDTIVLTWGEHPNKRTVSVKFDRNYYESKVVGSKIDREGTTSATRYDDSGTVYAVTDYVVVDDTVRALEKELQNLFIKEGGTVGGIDYANFLSTFVQSAIDYAYDKDVHGQDEYWNYPLQTLVLGKGDCEDTSILLAALFYAAGYDAAVVLLPEHAVAAISLTMPVYYPYRDNSYTYIDKSKDPHETKEYYMVETTALTSSLPVGEPEDSSMASAVHHIYPVTDPGKYV